MPSSPEAATSVAFDFAQDAAEPLVASPAAWQPVVLGSSATVAAATSVPVSAPEPFVVSERIGVPAAVLAEAHRIAKAQGYAAGFASGVSSGRQRAAAEQATAAAAAEQVEAAARTALAGALGALEHARADLATRTTADLAGLEQLLLDSAYAIAETLLGSALRDDAVRGRAAVARVLALAPSESGAVTVRLNPADLGTLSGLADVAPAHVTLVGDASIAPGDAIAQAGGATIESCVSDALARVREALS